MPNKICQRCRSQLLNFYIFKQKCKRTEVVLQQTVASKDSSYQPASSPARADVAENIPPPSVQSEEMVEILDSEQHLDETDELTNEAYDIPELAQTQCQLCDQTFHDEEALKQHTHSHFDVDCENISIAEEKTADCSEDQNDQNQSIASNESKPLTPIPEEEVYYLDGEEIEEIDHNSNGRDDYSPDLNTDENMQRVPANEENSDDVTSEDQWTCKICGKTIKGRPRYLRHIRSHDAHSNITEFFTYYTCKVCGRIFLQKPKFMEHIEASEHNRTTENMPTDSKTPYICGVCSTEHINIDHMKQHLLSHLNTFQCPFEGCGCEYTSAVRLGMHITSKHIEYASHECRLCGADSFDSMAELQQHLRMKCTGKKFPCGHCDKKFLTSRSLAQHLKCLEKKHHCDVCGKAFAQHGELKLHERIHNGERPFQCTVCGKRYKTASLRTAHMDSHIEGKTYECHLCGKRLQSRTCYRNHVRRHSEEKKHECDICSKKFYTKYNVKIHREKVHKLNQRTANKTVECP